MNLLEPPTEIEVAQALEVVNGACSKGVAEIVRRLAIQRDHLAKALVVAGDAFDRCRKHMEESITLLDKHNKSCKKALETFNKKKKLPRLGPPH